jgi:hypothetical protein
VSVIPCSQWSPDALVTILACGHGSGLVAAVGDGNCWDLGRFRRSLLDWLAASLSEVYFLDDRYEIHLVRTLREAESLFDTASSEARR